MKLAKLRICHYKSIVDSGCCDLASDITIFVGKNESGKTAVLEALRDFDKDIGEFAQNAFPLDGNDALPTIELCFKLDPADIDRISLSSGIPITEERSSHLLKKGLSIVKDGLGRYRLNDEFLLQLLEEKKGEKIEKARSSPPKSD